MVGLERLGGSRNAKIRKMEGLMGGGFEEMDGSEELQRMERWRDLRLEVEGLEMYGK